MKEWLDKWCGESTPLRQVVEKWIDEFKRDCTSINNAVRSGRTKYVTGLGIIKKICDIVLDDSKVKVRELAETFLDKIIRL